MHKKTVPIAVMNGETLTRTRFKSLIFFNITAQSQNNFEKPKMIKIQNC